MAGTVAGTARKGGRVHVAAGIAFAASMLVLGVVTASIIGPFASPPWAASASLPALAICGTSCAGRLSATQRLSRHLWRMCFAFFIATGSFLPGQQDVLPQALHRSPILFVLAFCAFRFDALLARAGPVLRSPLAQDRSVEAAPSVPVEE